MANLIEIKNATVYRGQNCVFDRFSLTIPLNCNTAILGPNGAGKSTLLKLLFRDLYPVYQDDSYVRILGEEQWNVWDLRAHLGIVSHDLQQQWKYGRRIEFAQAIEEQSFSGLWRELFKAFVYVRIQRELSQVH